MLIIALNFFFHLEKINVVDIVKLRLNLSDIMKIEYMVYIRSWNVVVEVVKIIVTISKKYNYRKNKIIFLMKS